MKFFLFISLLAQRNEPKKGRFFEGIFQPLAENHRGLAKFPPRLRKFLTPIPYYPDEKDLIRYADNNWSFQGEATVES